MKNSNYFLIAILIVLCSCAKPFTSKDNGKMKSLSIDDAFEIVLEGDTNSKFVWKLDLNPEIVKLEKPVETSESGNNETYTFNFRTVSAGEEIVKLIYTDGNSISKEFELKVIVGTVGLIESE